MEGPGGDVLCLAKTEFRHTEMVLVPYFNLLLFKIL